MVAHILLTRQLDVLAPHDELSLETIQGLPHGAIVRATISQPRNVQFHRKFFALVDLIYRNQSKYATREQVLTAIKVITGYCDWIDVNGERVPVPKSISFAKCDELKFQEFTGKVFEWVVSEIMPGVRTQDLQMRLLDLTTDRG